MSFLSWKNSGLSLEVFQEETTVQQSVFEKSIGGEDVEGDERERQRKR